MYKKDADVQESCENEPNTPRPKHEPLCLKPPDVSGPPKLAKGQSWRDKKHKRWMNKVELPLKEHLDHNTVNYVPHFPRTPCTQEPDKPLSRKNRRITTAKVAPALSVPHEILAGHNIESDNTTHATVSMNQCYVDGITDNVYFRIEQLYRGGVKPQGALQPLTSCLGERRSAHEASKHTCEPVVVHITVSASQAKSSEPVIVTSSWAKSPDPIQCSSSQNKSLSKQKKSYKNRSKTSEPRKRARNINSSLNPDSGAKPASNSVKQEVLRPKATASPEGSEVRELIMEKKNQLNPLANVDPFENLSLVLPKSRTEHVAWIEKDVNKDVDVQDINRSEQGDHLEIIEKSIKRSVSVGRGLDIAASSEDGAPGDKQAWWERRDEDHARKNTQKMSDCTTSVTNANNSLEVHEIPIRPSVSVTRGSELAAIVEDSAPENRQAWWERRDADNAQRITQKISDSSSVSNANDCLEVNDISIKRCVSVTRGSELAANLEDGAPGEQHERSPLCEQKPANADRYWKWRREFQPKDQIDKILVLQFDAFHLMLHKGPSTPFEEPAETEYIDSSAYVSAESSVSAETEYIDSSVYASAQSSVFDLSD